MNRLPKCLRRRVAASNRGSVVYSTPYSNEAATLAGDGLPAEAVLDGPGNSTAAGATPVCTSSQQAATVHAATRDRTESPSRNAPVPRSNVEDSRTHRRTPQVPGHAQAGSP